MKAKYVRDASLCGGCGQGHEDINFLEAVHRTSKPDIQGNTGKRPEPRSGTI